MLGPNIIFFLIFLLPLVVFLVWLMRQDRRKGTVGIIIVSILVVIGVVYTFLTREQAKKTQYQRTGTVVVHKDS